LRDKRGYSGNKRGEQSTKKVAAGREKMRGREEK
jgi:hypothetical protein